MPDLDRYLSDCKFILVSNREPYEHVRGVTGVEVRQPPGGLVSALDPPAYAALEEIDGALLTNPFNLDGFASCIRTALEMGRDERRRRIHRIRVRLYQSTIFDWLGAILGWAAEIMAEQSREPAR